MTATTRQMAHQAKGSEEDLSDKRHRHYDSSLKATVVQVFQADYYVSSETDEILATVLGSCISACIHDPAIRCGGMNHFLLPEQRNGADSEPASVALRYGLFSMEQLINAILTAGGERDRLEIKVFGGANVVKDLSGVGHRNADFIEGFLEREGLAVAGQHLRGNWPRKILFSPHSGQVRMREIKDKASASVFEQETKLSPRQAVNPQSGSIELFD